MNIMKMVDENNQQVMKGSGRTSLYLFVATILFLALLFMAWTGPATAQNHEAMLGGHLAPRNSANTILNVITDNAREHEYGNMIIKLVITGSRLEVDTKGDVDFDSLSSVFSLGWKNMSGIGETTVGLFAEGGSGSYDTYSGLRGGGRVRGDGQVDHYGGGVFFHNLFSSNTYLEASVRAGSLDNSYDTRDGVSAKFDISQTYYGAHLGVGQKMAVTPCAELDLYLKGIWTRTEGKTVRTSAVEKLKFDDIDSIRSRLGVRLTQGFDGDHQVKGYLGAAWEHEFNGEAKAKYVSGVNNRKDKAELKGSTALGEAGIIIDPKDSIVSVDVGIFGMAGQQKGLGGAAGLKFEF